MGRRTRRRGTTNAAVRDAQRKAEEVGRAVYAACRDVMDSGQDQHVPASVMGPLAFLGEHVAPTIARRLGGDIPEADREQLLLDIAAYLTSGYIAMIAEFNPAHFAEWREGANTVERSVEERAAAEPFTG